MKSIIELSHDMCDNCKKKSILYLRLDSGVFQLKQAIDRKKRGRNRIQIELKPDIFLEILQINKYNRGGDNCNGNIAAGQ